MYREPDHTERLTAQANARKALLEKFKPKPTVHGDDLGRRERERAARLEALRTRPKKHRPAPPPRRTQVLAQAVAVAVVVTTPQPPAEPPVRFSVTDGSAVRVRERNREAMLVWKRREWRSGTKHCGYCAKRMTWKPNRPNTVTVDHRDPLAREGDDAAWNWLLACLKCNHRKADMPEADFRALLAA